MPGGVDFGGEEWVSDGPWGDQIDVPGIQGLQRFQEAEPGVGVGFWGQRLELLQRIQVAPGRVKALRHGGAEQVETAHMKAPTKFV